MTTKTSGQTINELSPGQFLKLGKVIPSGSLGTLCTNPCVMC